VSGSYDARLQKMADRQKTTTVRLDDLPQMDREWRTWRGLCGELEKLGIDVNSSDPLVNAIKRWGEELVALRSRQDAETVSRVLEEARAAYPNLPND
jgi:hypothetical protein